MIWTGAVKRVLILFQSMIFGDLKLQRLPSATRDSADVAKLTIGISGAIAGLFLPGASAIGPIANFAIEKFVKLPENILLNELKSGNIAILDDAKAAAFIPMAYKFFEAAKEGEYEHNLRILAELLVNQMQSITPEVSAFARASRRIEALSLDDLKVIALIDATLSRTALDTTEANGQAEEPWVSAHLLAIDPLNSEAFDRARIKESLNDLASRGLLTVDGSTRWNKAEEYYFPSSSFKDLVANARNSLNQSVRGTRTPGTTTGSKDR
jgi:hypothetical protein